MNLLVSMAEQTQVHPTVSKLTDMKRAHYNQVQQN